MSRVDFVLKGSMVSKKTFCCEVFFGGDLQAVFKIVLNKRFHQTYIKNFDEYLGFGHIADLHQEVKQLLFDYLDTGVAERVVNYYRLFDGG